VGAVTPYYRRFLSAFPDVKALAGAPLDRVLKAWEGLGYYSRARNLHKAARLVVDGHGGRLPASVTALMALPGVGRSTAGAIAAIAFRRDAPILDANARRVLARFHAVRDDLRKASVERELWENSRRMILPGRGRETALAMMDLGAAICTPRNPRCADCPLAPWCASRLGGIQGEVPGRPAKRAIPHHDVVAGVIGNREGKFLVGRRPDQGLLGGLWEFPGGKREPGETLARALAREIRGKLGIEIEILGRLGTIRHGYSHFRVTCHAYRCRKTGGRFRPGGMRRWATAEELETYALPRVDRKLLEILARISHQGSQRRNVRERGDS
jgi:A/G-specific adenine glycosylase